MNVITGKIRGNCIAAGFNQFNIALYRNPSTCCGSGTWGCRNIGSFNNSPYNNSKKLL
jgi:hypothetical protein